MEKRPDPALLRSIVPEIVEPLLRKAERTRYSILQAAVGAFATHGIEGASYELIATRARVSRPLVQKYFPERDELYSLAMRFVFGNYQKFAIDSMLALDDGAKPAEHLEAFIRA